MLGTIVISYRAIEHPMYVECCKRKLNLKECSVQNQPNSNTLSTRPIGKIKYLRSTNMRERVKMPETIAFFSFLFEAKNRSMRLAF